MKAYLTSSGTSLVKNTRGAFRWRPQGDLLSLKMLQYIGASKRGPGVEDISELFNIEPEKVLSYLEFMEGQGIVRLEY